MVDVVSRQAFNRVLLERQMRQELSAFDAIGRLVGMQAQVPGAPYVGLWARLEDFGVEELSALIRERVARQARQVAHRNSGVVPLRQHATTLGGLRG
jgi:hypothetical protein